MSTPEQPAKWKAYRKGIVAGSGGAIVAGLAALDSTGILSDRPWMSAVVSVVTAMGVYQVRNEKPQAPSPDQTYTVPHPRKPRA